MTNYTKLPNLPVENVKTVIAGRLPEEIKLILAEKNISVLCIEENELLQKPVSTHADLQCIHLGKNKILLNDTQTALTHDLNNLGFNVSLFNMKNGEYPFDCVINAAFVGKNVICRYDILENSLKEFLRTNKYNIVNVNQGYSKCSVCVVDENSVITEDESINNACIKNGIDVLLIRKGFVKLTGYDYGFIGGASFKISKNTVCFIGKIENHPDFESIKVFLTKRNINYISIGKMQLTDVGSILPIIE